MLVSCNGIRVNSGSILMPRTGAWTADMRLDDSPPTGTCTISVAGQVTFVGTALDRLGTFRERHGVRIVGGAGGLSTEVPHRQHRGVPLRTPLERLLSDAGETLSTTSDAATLATSLGSWSRRAGTAGDALTELLRDAGASWRVLTDGTIWVGQETWPTLAVQASIIRDDPTEDTAEVATDMPVLRPGVTWNGRRVSAVEHIFEPSRVRTKVWYERGSNSVDRLKAALGALVRSFLSDVDYHPSYAATVIAQHGNGDLQVRIDDERFAREPGGTGTDGVKLWPGVPGISYVLRKGARVLIGYLDGRGRTPVATGWNSGTPERVTLEADRINLGDDAARGIARLNDTANTCTITATQVSPGSVLITFTPASGSPVSIALAGTALTVTPTSGTITSVINSASSKSYSE